MWYTYILKCANDSFYTGITNDLQKRLDAHNSGKGAKYTRANKPCELVWHMEHPTKEDALKTEWYIKQKDHKWKHSLIAYGGLDFEKQGSNESLF